MQQARPVVLCRRLAMREQQRRLEAGEVEQQLILQPTPGAVRRALSGSFTWPFSTAISSPWE